MSDPNEVKITNMTTIGALFWLAGFLFQVGFSNELLWVESEKWFENIIVIGIRYIGWPFFLGLELGGNM